MKKYIISIFTTIFLGFCLIALSGCQDPPTGTQTGVTFSNQPVSSINFYPAAIRGPAYLAISVTNNSSTTATITGVSLSNVGNGIAIDNNAADYLYPQCTTGSTLSVGGTCLVMIHATPNSPVTAPTTATLSIHASANGVGYNKSYTLTNTSYLYVAGAFSGIDGISVGQPAIQTLLAQCTGSNGILTTCSNALNAAAPAHDYASVSPGNTNNPYIFSLAALSNGNLYVAGGFDTIGSATVETANDSLLALCTPGGDCSHVFEANDAIRAIAYDASTNTLYAGGAFNSITGASVGGLGVNYLLAACIPGETCQNALGSGGSADGLILGLALNPASTSQLLVTGQFTNIGGSTVNQAFLANCSGADGSKACANALSVLPNASTFGVGFSTSGQLYLGGFFNSIGSVSYSSGQFPAVTCNLNGDCSNALGSNITSDHYIADISPDPANNNLLYISSGDTLGSATISAPSGTNSLLAGCTPNGNCINLLGTNAQNSNNYANEAIYDYATGSQLTAISN